MTLIGAMDPKELILCLEHWQNKVSNSPYRANMNPENTQRKPIEFIWGVC